MPGCTCPFARAADPLIEISSTSGRSSCKGWLVQPGAWQLPAASSHRLSQMDVPTRQALVMQVVEPGERTAAAAVTNAARYTVRPFGPLVAGALQQVSLGLPPAVAGIVKVGYDVARERQASRVAAVFWLLGLLRRCEHLEEGGEGAEDAETDEDQGDGEGPSGFQLLGCGDHADPKAADALGHPAEVNSPGRRLYRPARPPPKASRNTAPKTMPCNSVHHSWLVKCMTRLFLEGRGRASMRAPATFCEQGRTGRCAAQKVPNPTIDLIPAAGQPGPRSAVSAACDAGPQARVRPTALLGTGKTERSADTGGGTTFIGALWRSAPRTPRPATGPFTAELARPPAAVMGLPEVVRLSTPGSGADRPALRDALKIYPQRHCCIG
jgi:hypothetical protein